MERYSIAVADAIKNNRSEWSSIKKWIENFICGVQRQQQVVGNRQTPSGGTVSTLEFSMRERIAQVCPFVKDSIDQNYFWIEESPIADVGNIEAYLLSQILPFIQAPPDHDPWRDGAPPAPVWLKTFFTFFPHYMLPSPKQPDLAVDQMYARVRPGFMNAGLMLGQFYHGCDQPSVYNPKWRDVLTCPYLAFAIRYMAPHDRLFIKPGSVGHDKFQKLFPTAHP